MRRLGCNKSGTYSMQIARLYTINIHRLSHEPYFTSATPTNQPTNVTLYCLHNCNKTETKLKQNSFKTVLCQQNKTLGSETF